MESRDRDEKNVIGKSTPGDSPRLSIDNQDEDAHKSSSENLSQDNVIYKSSSENSPRGMLGDREKAEETVDYKSSSENSPRGILDNEEKAESNVDYRKSSKNSPRENIVVENAGDKSSSESSPREILDNQDKDKENVDDKSSLENSSGGILNYQEADVNTVADKSILENSPRDVPDYQDRVEDNMANRSSYESSSRDILDDQGADKENVADISSVESSSKDVLGNKEEAKNNVIDKSSSESFLRDIIDNQDADRENVADKLTVVSSPRDVLDDQEEAKKNLIDRSSLENFPRDILDNQDADTENVADYSSVGSSPRDIFHDQEDAEKNVIARSSPENSPRDILDNQDADNRSVADNPSVESFPRDVLIDREEAMKNVIDRSSLENSPRDILDNQDADKEHVADNSSVESFPTDISSNQDEAKKKLIDRSSSEDSPRDILDNQDAEENAVDNSSVESSLREVLNIQDEAKNMIDRSSLENSTTEILDKQDIDNEDMSVKSSLENSPRDIPGNQDGAMKNVSDESISDPPRGILDIQDEEEEYIADKSSLKNSPRGIPGSQNETKKEVVHESSSENSKTDILDNKEKDEVNVAVRSNMEDSSSDNLNNQVEEKKTTAYKSSVEYQDTLDNLDEENLMVSYNSSFENAPRGILDNQEESLKVSEDSPKNQLKSEGDHLHQQVDKEKSLGIDITKQTRQSADGVLAQDDADPVFDGTEAPELKETGSSSRRSVDLDTELPTSAWPETLKNYVKEKGATAVSSVIRVLSGKKDDNFLVHEEVKNVNVEADDSVTDSKQKETSQKEGERGAWNPLNYIKAGRETDTQNKSEQAEDGCADNSVVIPVMKGRIIVYTRLGCEECKYVRTFMQQKKLKYVEINIDIYPSRKLELEKRNGSCVVPKIYFNDFVIGGLSELKAMGVSGKLDEKIEFVIKEEASRSAPLPPQSGEDDETGRGKIDELASIVRKMKESIVLRDRFCKMRKFSNCFLGSEAVDFFSEDQHLQREEAVEFGKKLASKHFFRHILDENVFEDGNHLYRFLEHDPIVMSQCYNISWGTIDVEPKRITDIASRLRFLCFAIFEAYVSEDGRHVDYRSIHNSEEFQRYLRIVEELQRVDLDVMSREEKLAFFINLYNMMAIHAILTWGYPVGVLDRRRFLGDFKYVIGGCTYSLSAIQNGILRGNQRPPYNLMKPFGLKEKRFKVALPFTEPLVHFALVCGTRSGPALRCYSPGNIDKELMEAAHNFLRNGGFVVDVEAKVASVSRILWWYNVDFGKNEVEVLKHAANYLEPDKSEELLELLSNTQLKVIYQPFDWSLNC